GYGFQGSGSRGDWRRGATTPGFGAEFKHALLTRPGPWEFWIGGWGECLPRPDNRVALHPTLKDKWGIPALHIQCTFGPNELEMLKDMQVTAAEVLVTAGGQSALTCALRSLAPPGAPVLVESPTYPGLLAIARAAGLRPVPVPVDADGVIPERLEEAFAVSGARLFVCQPLFQNPTGTVLPAGRRRAVLAAAKRAGAFVVEDDFARLLAHPGAGELPAPLVADDPDGTVVHVRSLTKAASPSLRVGALVARGPALARLRSVQAVDSFFVPRPLQEAALELVTAADWPRHLRALARELADRQQLFAAALAQRAPALLPPLLPRGGFHLWLPLPAQLDPAAFTAAALRHGVALSPGRNYFTAEPAPRTRVSLAAAETRAQLATAVDRLAAALESLDRPPS
ncbi:MAG: PLP-dependent aminotransferase family protein, partial [Kitasatospora sp.]|nr:PLP-dependent aminotransferase family protein [Kitasatospora sp.]